METKKRTARALVERLSSASPETRRAALAELRLISKHDPESRPLIAGAGAVPCLVDALYTGGGDQENAAAALLNLSISSRQLLISAPGLLDGISDLLLRHRHPTTPPPPAAVQSAAATLHSLLLSEPHRPLIGGKRDILFALIDIVRHPASPPRSVKDALKALFGLALWPGNRPAMVEMGAVAALFGVVVNSERVGGVGVVEDATAVAAQVAGCRESAEAFGRAGGVAVMADLVELGAGAGAGGRARENAVAGMLNLARWGGAEAAEEVRRACLEGGVLEGVMEVAVSGSGKGRGKARELLAILNNDRRHNDDDDDDDDGGGGDASLGNVRFDFVLDHDYDAVVSS